jgi:hypothetical protein
MGAEQVLLKQGLKALPEAAANKLIAEVIPNFETTALGRFAKTTAAAQESESGVQFLIFGGGKKASEEEIRRRIYSPTGPVWNEEVLYRRSTVNEIAQDSVYGWLSKGEEQTLANNRKWFEGAGFKFDGRTQREANKKIETDGELPQAIVSRIAQASKSHETIPTPISTHFYRGTSGQVRQFDSYDTKAAAELLGYSPRTIQVLAHDKLIPGHKIDGPHGPEWRVLLPSFKRNSATTFDNLGHETEESLFRKALEAEDDHFRMPFQYDR